MDTNLDQADGYRGSDEEFEQFLDDFYAAQEAEAVERMMADQLYSQMEYDKLEKEMGPF